MTNNGAPCDNVTKDGNEWIGGVVKSNRNTSSKALYDKLNENGLAWHKHGYSGHENLSEGQVDQALKIFGGFDVKDPDAFRYLQNLQAMKRNYAAEAAAAEYQNSMLEMYERMAKAAEAANQIEYQQPTSKAPEAWTGAQDDSAKKQAMRRGILSLTRYSDYGGGSQTLGVA